MIDFFMTLFGLPTRSTIEGENLAEQERQRQIYGRNCEILHPIQSEYQRQMNAQASAALRSIENPTA